MTVNTPRIVILLTLILSTLGCSLLGTPPATSTQPAPPSTLTPTATAHPVLAVIRANADAPKLVRCVNTGEFWNLRSEPDETSYIRAVLDDKVSVEVISGGTWLKVRVLTGEARGLEGFIRAGGLSECE